MRNISDKFVNENKHAFYVPKIMSLLR